MRDTDLYSRLLDISEPWIVALVEIDTSNKFPITLIVVASLTDEPEMCCEEANDLVHRKQKLLCTSVWVKFVGQWCGHLLRTWGAMFLRRFVILLLLATTCLVSGLLAQPSDSLSPEGEEVVISVNGPRVWLLPVSFSYGSPGAADEVNLEVIASGYANLLMMAAASVITYGNPQSPDLCP